MKYLKYIIIFFSIILSLPLIIAVFAKNSYLVEKNIVVEQNKTKVFNYLRLLKNQETYSVCASIDSTTEYTYTGTDGAVGFIGSWESDNEQVGKGYQEIVNIKNGNRIDYVIHFKEPFESTGDMYLVTDSIAPMKTKVTWGFTSEMPYPMNFILFIVDFETIIGNDLQEGLNNLKKILD